MKINHSLIFVVICLLCCNAFATLEAEMDKYKKMIVPNNKNVSVANLYSKKEQN